ncbi:hypothetical protein BDB00DRAFT_899576 [Zychaea mexicana]|uniref:uncharacterized protein n=1 Tax=Zychaea mexicana TaxID=64656 RepID=UPI0022FE25D9|nr:uncharacterized protein BDB00DRAFT_899576 [Zychaea mexicana]KAI9495365.1 hypothetical protein BDB00DRAFT_899576 [Zychaea mexicana]
MITVSDALFAKLVLLCILLCIFEETVAAIYRYALSRPVIAVSVALVAFVVRAECCTHVRTWILDAPFKLLLFLSWPFPPLDFPPLPPPPPPLFTQRATTTSTTATEPVHAIRRPSVKYGGQPRSSNPVCIYHCWDIDWEIDSDVNRGVLTTEYVPARRAEHLGAMRNPEPHALLPTAAAASAHVSQPHQSITTVDNAITVEDEHMVTVMMEQSAAPLLLHGSRVPEPVDVDQSATPLLLHGSCNSDSTEVRIDQPVAPLLMHGSRVLELVDNHAMPSLSVPDAHTAASACSSLPSSSEQTAASACVSLQPPEHTAASACASLPEHTAASACASLLEQTTASACSSLQEHTTASARQSLLEHTTASARQSLPEHIDDTLSDRDVQMEDPSYDFVSYDVGAFNSMPSSALLVDASDVRHEGDTSVENPYFFEHTTASACSSLQYEHTTTFVRSSLPSRQERSWHTALGVSLPDHGEEYRAAEDSPEDSPADLQPIEVEGESPTRSDLQRYIAMTDDELLALINPSQSDITTDAVTTTATPEPAASSLPLLTSEDLDAIRAQVAAEAEEDDSGSVSSLPSLRSEDLAALRAQLDADAEDLAALRAQLDADAEDLAALNAQLDAEAEDLDGWFDDLIVDQ